MFRNSVGLFFIGCSLSTSALTHAKAESMSYFDVWSTVKEAPYRVLPDKPTTLASFSQGGVDLLKKRATMTLNDKRDIIPYFQKLVHPIGICFAGTWSITAPNRYTGYFAEGSKGRIIVRASEALGQPLAGDYRSFGLAGKIFPTDDPNDTTPYESANFFTVDDLGGAMSDSFMDLPKLNEPKLSFHFSSLWILPLVTKIAKTFSSADSNAGIRQLYQISELGLNGRTQAVTPKWMMLQAETKPNYKHSDFRNELNLKNNPNGLRFAILVADAQDNKWRRLGSIDLNEQALTQNCDHRLHFQHPRSK